MGIIYAANTGHWTLLSICSLKVAHLSSTGYVMSGSICRS